MKVQEGMLEEEKQSIMIHNESVLREYRNFCFKWGALCTLTGYQ